MLDINLFRTEKGGNPDIVRESQKKRCPTAGEKQDAALAAVDGVIALDKQWREQQFKLEALRKELNTTSKAVGVKKKAKENADELIATTKQLKADIAASTETAAELEGSRDTLLGGIGNLVHDSVPVGDDEAKDNTTAREFLTAERREEAGLLNHVDIFYRIDGSDIVRGTAVAGGRGYFLKGHAVMLNQALINYGLAFLSKRGYTPLHTPFFMLQHQMAACAQLAQFDEELYKVSGEGEDKYLIATSEQAMCAYHQGLWLDPKDLPIRYAGYSSCFRKEAGSHGRDTLGIFRIHQFEKVEQFVITTPEEDASWKEFDQMIAASEEFYQSLKLPYRVENICSGELNDAAAKKYDLEAWFPGSKKYRELVSCSNCLDYQARRLETRLSGMSGERESNIPHMLNSTLTATERTLCCLVENYQCEEGVRVPEILQPFMGGLELIPYVRDAEAPPKEKKQKKSKAKKKAEA